MRIKGVIAAKNNAGLEGVLKMCYYYHILSTYSLDVCLEEKTVIGMRK